MHSSRYTMIFFWKTHTHTAYARKVLSFLFLFVVFLDYYVMRKGSNCPLNMSTNRCRQPAVATAFRTEQVNNGQSTVDFRICRNA